MQMLYVIPRLGGGSNDKSSNDALTLNIGTSFAYVYPLSGW